MEECVNQPGILTTSREENECTIRSESERGTNEGVTDSDTEGEGGFNPAVTSTRGKKHRGISPTSSPPPRDPRPSTVKKPQPSLSSAPTKK